MNPFERDQILDEINGCKLTAEVATAARNDEICEHLRNIINALNLPKMIVIKPSIDESIVDRIPRVKMTLDNDNSSQYPITTYLEFDDVNGYVRPRLNLEGLAYKSFYYGSNSCMMLKAMNAVAENLNKLYEHVNSDVFKAYEADIKTYIDAGKNLKRFDEDAREEKIKQTALSFHADQTLKDSNGVTHLIRKATNKRLWLSNWHYYNGAAKQSEDKMLIAQWIVNGSWSICI